VDFELENFSILGHNYSLEMWVNCLEGAISLVLKYALLAGGTLLVRSASGASPEPIIAMRVVNTN